MAFKNTLITAGAAALVAAPIAAQAQDVSRSAAPVTGESELGGDIGRVLIVALIAAAGMAALVLTDDDDEDVPISV